MAQSKCPNCNGNTFEGKKQRIIGIQHPITFVQCTSCGCVVGVLDTEIWGNHIINGVEALAKMIQNIK